ncbi:hypothetical protein BRW65_22685 [Mycobacterium paraffinicum]|uniref:Uncharacterized protein n=2 Tax=Mycobacteriaceae TaxID=1762 RepID=A0A1Q4HNZ3_9MYCO|nr:hypothetical protein A5689_15475 [Mycobacterium intracellulare subsp. yongonense]OJZ69421.1 hypothetical protein BRW65_22685 [Mycobacterium paraffinicum]
MSLASDTVTRMSNHVTTYRFTTIAVGDLPYPEGLGKAEYPELEFGMKRLLGHRWDDPVANERSFWTPTYQNLIHTHLKPHFDRHGDIVEIATQAVNGAHASHALNRDITGTYAEAFTEYRCGIPSLDDLQAAHGPVIAWWILDPPRIFCDGRAMWFVDGRHRLSYLRSLLQPSDPGFPILVELSRSAIDAAV